MGRLPPLKRRVFRLAVSMMNMTPKHEVPELPSRILELSWSFTASCALNAAIRLNFFTHIDRGCATVQEIATAAQASLRGTRALLDALVGLSLLAKQGERYELIPLSQTYLVRDKPFYLGKLVEHGQALLNRWASLEEVVRAGGPTVGVNEEERAKEFFPELVRALFPTNYLRGRAVAEALEVGSRLKGLKILDVAAGSAPWSIAMAERDPEARVTALDFPPVLEVAREMAAQYGVASRFSYLAGNMMELDFGEEGYDLVILGNICHAIGASQSQEIIAKSFRALVRRGQILIIESVPNDERTGPPDALLFGINMLLNTTDGDVFTFSEYRSWLEGAGFEGVEYLPVPAGPSSFQAILAVK